VTFFFCFCRFNKEKARKEIATSPQKGKNWTIPNKIRGHTYSHKVHSRWIFLSKSNNLIFCLCIICFKIKNPPPVELCWQKKEIPRKSLIFWVGSTSRQNLTLNVAFIYETQNNYYVQKGFSYHIILFE
jgi:hypothetical protein